MKNIKKLFQEFNQPDALMVFSSYALKDSDIKEQNALSWYTPQLLSTLPKSQKIVVLSETTKKGSNKIVQKDNILIIPCWQKRDFRSILNITYYYSAFTQVKNVLIEFEFNYFGHIFGPLIMFFTLAYLKILRKKVLFQIHEIVSNLYIIRKQINLNNKAALLFFNFSLGIFYKLVNLFSDKILVTESALANKFKKITGSKKIVVLPIMVKDRTKNNDSGVASLPRMTLKKLRNKFVLLFFGYLSWYKGIDWLLEVFPKLKKQIPNLVLVVAGDKSPTLIGDNHYEAYYEKLNKLMNKKDIIQTGFIDDRKVRLWLNACDVLILPYRVFKSSSGPLSWALSYKKPVLFSKALVEYKKSDDFKEAMQKSGITDKEIFFDFSADSLSDLLKTYNLKKLSGFSKYLAQFRSKQNVAKTLTELINTQPRKKYSLAMQLLINNDSGQAGMTI